MHPARVHSLPLLILVLTACSSYRARPAACTDCKIQLRNAEASAIELWTAYNDGRNAQYHSTLYPGEVRVLPSHIGGRIEVRAKGNADARGGCYPIDGPGGSTDKLLRLECRLPR